MNRVSSARAHEGGARATSVQPTRVYFGTQQIHARRETRARFDPPIRWRQTVDRLLVVTIT